MKRFGAQGPVIRMTGYMFPLDVILVRDILAARGMTLSCNPHQPASAVLVNSWNCLEANIEAIWLASRTGLPTVMFTAMVKKRQIEAMAEAGARVLTKPSGILALPYVLREEINVAAERYPRFASGGRP